MLPKAQFIRMKSEHFNDLLSDVENTTAWASDGQSTGNIKDKLEAIIISFKKLSFFQKLKFAHKLWGIKFIIEKFSMIKRVCVGQEQKVHELWWEIIHGEFRELRPWVLI